MSDTALAFRAAPAFGGLLKPAGTPPPGGPGLLVRELDGLNLVSLQALSGQEEALAERLRGRYGLTLPDGPRVLSGNGIRFLATGPESWLAVAGGRTNTLAPDLAEACGAFAAITDQSDGYGVLRLSGPRVRDVLAKGFTLDLHPSAFPPGSAAVTAAAHIGTILWRDPADDETYGPSFEVALFRSYAASFWHWLSGSAAEYGLAIEGS